MAHFIPKEDRKHDIIRSVWRKTLTTTTSIYSVYSDGQTYTFSLWLMKQNIQPIYRSGQYMGCSFNDEKEFLGWMLKHN